MALITALPVSCCVEDKFRDELKGLLHIEKDELFE